MLPYALTIFTGAFLLFQVQPLIGKYILPWFGGSPGVWTTCLLFFQVLLLGGYAYAHLLSTRVRPRAQVIVHLALLALALVLLPITPTDSWKPETGEDPTGRILLLLSVSIGLPYFVLSATGPLVQQWFSRTHPGASPYRLYALSNVGSLLALLSYPFYFEPRLTRQDQAQLWTGGLFLYVACCLFCAYRIFRSPAIAANSSVATDLPMASEAVASAPDASVTSAVREPSASVAQRAGSPTPSRARETFFWIAFPALASVLLVATTNKLCQDVAVIPFLWVLPLCLYLLSFILCFDHPRWYSRGIYAALLVGSIGVLTVLLTHHTSIRLPLQVAGYSVALFVACMICHGELYRLKPAPAQLTRFYLCISAGGALGGLLVAVVAPALFSRYVELQVGLGLLLYLLGVICLTYQVRSLALGLGAGAFLAAVLIPVVQASKGVATHGWGGALTRAFKEYGTEYGWYVGALLLFILGCLWAARPLRGGEWRLRLAGIPMSLALATGIFFVIQIGDEISGTVVASRNFYGTLTVVEWQRDDDRLKQLALTHGNITHGLQFLGSPLDRLITSYYGEQSGVGRAIASVPSLGGKRIGVVGLGTGTLALYGEEGDRIRFYEINPAVEELARDRFTFLKQSAADVSVVLGDARLTLERELDEGDLQGFDVLALDAFSSDAIPVHLLTKEAFELYLQHMRWGGIIAVHTSNRFLNLEPAIYRVARELGLQVVTISDDPPEDQWWLYRSTWVLLSRLEASLSTEAVVGGIGPLPMAPKDVRLWTDDYASILPLLR